MLAKVGKNIVKYILFIFNVIFAISGIGLIIAGSCVISDVIEFDHFLEGRAKALPAILIVVGILVFFVASMGCYGAIRESPSLLMGFAVFLGIIFIVELAIGIAAIVYKSELEMAINDSLQNTIRRSSSYDIKAWDKVQMSLKCCGVTGTADWIDMSKNKTIRPSCCRPEFVDETSKDCKDSLALYRDRYYQNGCINELEMKMRDSTTILIGVGIGIAFLQLIGIILAVWLASKIKNQNSVRT